jgi:Glycosyltransferase WbsX
LAQLFLVYRANRLPEPRKTAELWRREAERAGLPGLYLVRVESFKDECGDPRDIGFDTALEFQPRGNCSTEQGFVGGSGGIYESSVRTNQACGKTLLWTTGDW